MTIWCVRKTVVLLLVYLTRQTTSTHHQHALSIRRREPHGGQKGGQLIGVEGGRVADHGLQVVKEFEQHQAMDARPACRQQAKERRRQFDPRLRLPPGYMRLDAGRHNQIGGRDLKRPLLPGSQKGLEEIEKGPRASGTVISGGAA